jgi:3-methyladenine DNA glycosylase AlkD
VTNDKLTPITTARQARQRLASLSDATIARHSQRFFKTGKGDYAEGDRFRGIRVPVLRRVAQSCAGMPVGETLRLLRSPYHEDRLVALIVMVRAYVAGDQAAQERIARADLANLEYVNNWDLVDSSAPYILGAHLLHRSRSRLSALARSRNVWERRVAIITTAQFIRHGEATETLRIATTLLTDEHDLIHKAVGWMLREVGHRCDARLLRDFLDAHAARMPRTMLRYAIEHFAPNERQRYLKMTSGGADRSS